MKHTRHHPVSKLYLLIVLAPVILQAQRSGPGASTRVEEVRLSFSATDARGRPVTGLTANDIRVADAGELVANILSFHAYNDLPLRLGLVIDVSDSAESDVDAERDAVGRFLEQAVRPDSDRGFVAAFGERVQRMQEITSRPWLSALPPASVGDLTALYDALYGCVEDLQALDDRSEPTRRALVVLSDGQDNLSHLTVKNVIELAQRTDTAIYAIHVQRNRNRRSRGDPVLRALADTTGGLAFFPADSAQMQDALAAIDRDLRAQYLVSFKPERLQRDGRFHSLQVVAAPNQTIRTRSRRGYYEPDDRNLVATGSGR